MKKKKKKIILWGFGDYMYNYEVFNGVKIYFGYKMVKIICCQV